MVLAGQLHAAKRDRSRPRAVYVRVTGASWGGGPVGEALRAVRLVKFSSDPPFRTVSGRLPIERRRAIIRRGQSLSIHRKVESLFCPWTLGKLPFRDIYRSVD